MSYSIVIPSRNLPNLEACIQRLREQNEMGRVIVVWDGDSIPDISTFKMWREGSGEIILGVKPFCFARNANIGINAAGRDDVVLLNDDCLLETPRGFL